MEKELNIAAILKEKPKGTKLWSPIFGEVRLSHIFNYEFWNSSIEICSKDNSLATFIKDGKYNKNGEVCLFPSEQMQDWSKFAWKKGDVLTDISDIRVLFVDWVTNDYTRFRCKSTLDLSMEEYDTKGFISVSDGEAKKTINEIEESYNGKLNLETLEIEWSKPEFKDGDIITIEDTEYKAIIIYKSNGDCMFRSYALIDNVYNQLGIDKIVNALGSCTRLATDTEKQQLFDALAKEGKRWNPNTKTIEDLPKKCEFKAFDKVLVRDRYNDEWMAGFFSHYVESSEDFVCTSGSWRQCIPYNEETQHLLGTTDEWKGGEG